MAAQRTFGVAIPVPDPFGAQLQSHRASFGDPLAGAIPAHITLLPPTQLPATQDVGAHLAAAAASAGPFTIHLRGTDTFRPVSPVVFVPLVEGAGDCERLERQVRRGPLRRELAFPYHPHVTVAHHLPDERLDEAFGSLADFECTFQAREILLYEHGADGVWRPQQRYPLTASANGAAPRAASANGTGASS